MFKAKTTKSSQLLRRTFPSKIRLKRIKDAIPSNNVVVEPNYIELRAA